MRKFLALLLAVAATLVGGMVVAQPAAAASNGYHVQSIGCNGMTVVLRYTVSGIGSSTLNSADMHSVTWTSSPAAQYDRLQLSYMGDYFYGDDEYVASAAGSTYSSENDVPSSGQLSNVPGYTWNNGIAGTFRVRIWGGPDPEDGMYCFRDRTVL